MLKKIINADDFGISPGVNKAIITAFQSGVLNSASLMMNVAYTKEAVESIRENPGLDIGIHVNLTSQKNQMPLSDPSEIPLLLNKAGLFAHGFLGLLGVSFFKKKAFQKQLEVEIRAQIKKAKSLGIQVAHLDSHRHIHMIPAIFSVFKKIQEEYHIPRLRVVNENIFYTLATTRNFRCLLDGGGIKYLILKLFYYINGVKSETYFYSIVHTTRLFGRNIQKIRVPGHFKAVELGVHPALTAIDREICSPAFSDYLLYSKDRQSEFEALMDLGLLKRISSV